MDSVMRMAGIQNFLFVAITVILIFSLCDTSVAQPEKRRAEIAAEIQSELGKLMHVWYPRVIDDEFGGYLSRFSYNWQQQEPQDKMIVTQARHLWTLSKIGESYPEDSTYRQFAAHGFRFLEREMWDQEYGGFYQLVARDGEPLRNNENQIGKTLYGNAFALFGLSAYYEFSGDPAALHLAKQTFNWLDTHSRDPVHGGYFQPMSREGTPDTTGTPKDYNSGIHIMEALTALYKVWPDELVRKRLEEMFYIVRDTMVAEKGYLKLNFQRDWTHLSFRDSSKAVILENLEDDHVTPGHDIETAFLLLETADVLEMGEDPKTHRIAKQLTDHTLEHGWEESVGGIYEVGYYFQDDQNLTIIEDTKTWWAQAEALNTLLIMADLYPQDRHNYFGKFEKQWEYIQKYMIDSEHGGWYPGGIDKEPESKKGLKAQIWKGNYHTIRTLLNCLDRLEM